MVPREAVVNTALVSIINIFATNICYGDEGFLYVLGVKSPLKNVNGKLHKKDCLNDFCAVEMRLFRGSSKRLAQRNANNFFEQNEKGRLIL